MFIGDYKRYVNLQHVMEVNHRSRKRPDGSWEHKTSCCLVGGEWVHLEISLQDEVDNFGSTIVPGVAWRVGLQGYAEAITPEEPAGASDRVYGRFGILYPSGRVLVPQDCVFDTLEAWAVAQQADLLKQAGKPPCKLEVVV